MWAKTTSSRDNWERLVAAVIKKDQIWQLCHQDSITTVDSDFSDRTLSLRSVSSVSSHPPPFSRNSVVEERRGGRETITHKLFSALLRRNKHKAKEFDLVGISEDYFGVESFSLRELQVATDQFSNKNILGRGGFSKVYKGRLEDGSVVAVKKFMEKKPEDKIKEELEISTTVSHHNVISLHGFCITEKELLFVYPYMANGSVASCLRGRPDSQPPLEWAVRKGIAVDVARGLAHLHHECTRDIIHRDVKAANILLNEDFEAVVSDFSIAKFADSDDDVLRGTIGHIAPEYLSTGKSSSKTDVFGYGVFLLELITGQRAFDLARLADDDDAMLFDWVKHLVEEKKTEMIVDPDLRDEFDEEEVEKMMQIALICTQTCPEGRSMMSEVVMMLEDGHGLTETWEEFSSNREEFSSNIFEHDDFNLIDSDFAVSGDELSGPR